LIEEPLMQRDSALPAVHHGARPRRLRVISPAALVTAVSVVLLLIVAFAGLRLLSTQRQVAADLRQATSATAALAVAEAALHRLEAATARELLAARAEEGVVVQNAGAELRGALDLLAQRGGPAERARALTLRDEAEQLAAAIEQVRGLAQRGEREAAMRAFYEAIRPSAQRLAMALAEDRRRAAAATDALGQVLASDEPAHQALLVGALAGLLMLLFGGLIGLRQRQLRAQVLDGLGEALARVGRYVVAFLSSSQQYATGSAHQAAAIEEMATTTEELSANAGYVAQSAERAAQLTGSSQEAVRDTIARMVEVQDKVAAAVARITALGEQSERVGVIANLINDIASKTHLLSVNAAIEAVTAGPHGQRFAVVAGQVKDLTTETQEATAQVQSIVAEIRAATAALVTATKEAAQVAEAGAAAAHRAGTAMDDVVRVVETISHATQGQATIARQVAQTMRHVVDVSRQSAEVSRQAAAEAQRLKDTADDLVRLAADLERL
jgi:methyl-accepting chemotaxis protein